MAESVLWPRGSRTRLGLLPSFSVRQPVRVLESAFDFNSQMPLEGGRLDSQLLPGMGDRHLPACESAYVL